MKEATHSDGAVISSALPSPLAPSDDNGGRKTGRTQREGLTSPLKVFLSYSVPPI